MHTFHNNNNGDCCYHYLRNIYWHCQNRLTMASTRPKLHLTTTPTFTNADQQHFCVCLLLRIGCGFRSNVFFPHFLHAPHFVFSSLFGVYFSSSLPLYVSAKLQSNITNTSLSACKLKIISILFQSNQLICGFLDSTILRVNFDRYFLDLASHQFKLILISI